MTTAAIDQTQPAARPRRWWRRLVVFVVVPYLAICMILFAAQRKLIYHPTRTGPLQVDTFAIAGARTEAVSFVTADGITLGAWLVRSTTSPEEQRPLVLFFHGNGGDRSWRTDTLEILAASGADVLIFDYRGYAENAGSPSEAGLAQDARGAWEYAVRDLKVAPERIVLFGESLGGGAAVPLAAELSEQGTVPGGLIICASFSSLEDVAAWHFPWLPTRWLLRDRYRSAQRAPQVTCPILLLHGKRDTIVPYEIGLRLFEAFPASSRSGTPKQMVDLPTADHNDILLAEPAKFRRSVAEFLSQTAAGGL